MRVAVLAEDDTATRCLEPLAARGCEVLGLSSGCRPCPHFARRCLELGHGFTSSQDAATTAHVLSSFRPDLVVRVPDLGGALPAGVAEVVAAAAKQYGLRVGQEAKGAPWPEFAPIWLQREVSRVAVVPLGDSSKELASLRVPVTSCETALSLRVKHAAAAAELLAAVLDGGELPSAAAEPAALAADQEVPAAISLDWDEETVERFIRAHLFPPRDAAVAVDPTSGDKYFIESIEQFRQFRHKVRSNGHAEDGTGNGPRLYAADTHWYSNVGGSIIRMGDSQLHEPTRTTDKMKKAVIPGAALGARKKLRMNEPIIGLNAHSYCSSVLASGWIGVEGPFVKQLERHLAQICGCAAACAVQSGTAALYGAMKALGVSDDSDHVLVPAFTCAACADAVVHAGGRPVPIDCDLDSYGISLEAVRRALDADKDVRGIVVAPCYGVPARDFGAIYALCKERGIWLCEDACESYGATHVVKSQEGGSDARVPVGSLATLCVVSVRSEKMIGVGEGGAILGNDAALVAKAKWWCSRAPSRGVGLWRVYEHDAVGQNFRMPEMLAAIGVASAEMLPLMKERKRRIHAWYTRQMETHPGLKGVELQKSASGDDPVWWLNAALLPEGLPSEKVGMQIMHSYPDIEIRPGFFPLHQMAIFQSTWLQPCPNSEMLYRRIVCLPSASELTEADVERICCALAEAIATVGAAVAAESSSA